VNPVVNSIGGVGVNNPKGVEVSAKKRFIGGDVEGEDVVHSFEPGKHGEVGKKRHMNRGSQRGFLTRGKKDLKPLKEGR